MHQVATGDPPADFRRVCPDPTTRSRCLNPTGYLWDKPTLLCCQLLFIVLPVDYLRCPHKGDLPVGIQSLSPPRLIAQTVRLVLQLAVKPPTARLVLPLHNRLSAKCQRASTGQTLKVAKLHIGWPRSFPHIFDYCLTHPSYVNETYTIGFAFDEPRYAQSHMQDFERSWSYLPLELRLH